MTEYRFSNPKPDPFSETWEWFLQFLDKKIAHDQKENDKDLNDTETAKLRGRNQARRELLHEMKTFTRDPKQPKFPGIS